MSRSRAAAVQQPSHVYVLHLHTASFGDVNVEARMALHSSHEAVDYLQCLCVGGGGEGNILLSNILCA